MKITRPLIAAAVASVCAAGPVLAQEAELPEVYGRVNLGIQHVNEDGVGTYGQDEGLGLMSVASRVGVKGEHDINDDLTALYRYEFAVDATEATINAGNRLSWIGLEGEFGRLKAGRVWSAWYTHLGYNTDRSQFWGGTGYYGYPSFGLNEGMPTTRVSDTVQYTYGGGGYSTDPFTFTAEIMMDGSSAGVSAKGDALEEGGTADPQDMDLITLAGQATFGDVSVNAALRQQSSNDETVDIEPSQTGVGVRWNSGPLYLGGSYIQTDRDTDDNDSPSMVEVLATYEFDDGLTGQLSVSQLDNDMDNDAGNTTGVFAQLDQSLTEQLNVYIEGQSLDVDGGDGEDSSPMVVLTGLGYSF